MIELARRLYRKLLAVDRVNQVAWKSTYAGKWLQWCRAHDCGREFGHPRELHDFIIALPDLAGAINYMEFGVHKGESIRWWVEQNRHPESRFYGFDSFEGLPEDWRSDFRKGHFSTSGKTPEIADDRCSFQVGWFHVTLPSFLRTHESAVPTVVHLDGDLYSSTSVVLYMLAPKFKDGDILIFDDFSDSLHVFRAFLDFFSSFPIEYELIAQAVRYNRIAVRVKE